MLRFAAAIGAAAGAALAAVLVLRLPVWAVFTAMAGLGAYRGLYNPPLESIFADSIVTGERCSHVKSISVDCATCLQSASLQLVSGGLPTVLCHN